MKDQNEKKLNNSSGGLEISAFSYDGDKEVSVSVNEPVNNADVYVDAVYLGISKKLKVIRFVLLFAIIIITLFALMRFSSGINLYSIKEFFYSFAESEISLNAESVVISGADLIDADSYKNYLLMLRTDRVDLYKADGSRYMTKRISMSNPTVKCSDKYFLIYDLGGFDLCLFNTVDVIYEESFDNTIYIADINKNGYLALLTHDVSYASQLLVYNEDMERLFEWNSADKYTPCMKMLKDGHRIAAASFSSNLGISTVTFNLFDIKSDEAVTHTFSDTLPLEVGEIGNGTYLLCSDRLVFFDSKGELIKEIDFIKYGNTVSEVYCDGKTLAAVFEDEGYSYGSKLVLFNKEGEVLFTCDEEYEISSAAVINGELFYINYGELISVNIEDKTEKRTSLTDSYSDIFEVSGNLVLVSKTETLILS